MDAVKRTYRSVQTAGDEARKDIGNLGDEVDKAGRGSVGSRSDPASTPDRPK